MTVENDIKNTINLLNGSSNNNYKWVKLHSNNSLKHFKNYKLDNKEVLSKINSIDEILDLITYNSNITCFSSNILYKYFLLLFIQMHTLNRKDYLNFVFDDYKNNKMLSKSIYDYNKNNLTDEVREFFDEIYKYCKKNNIDISTLILNQNYEYKIIQMYTRNYLSNHYYEVKDKNVNIIICKDDEINSYFEKESIDFINLSYNIDKCNKDKFKLLLKRERTLRELLKENGKIQSFISKKEIIIPGYKIINTRSIDDPYTSNELCKKEYAYMYKMSK